MKKISLLFLAGMLTVLPALAVEENVPILLNTPTPPVLTPVPIMLTPVPIMPTPIPILPLPIEENTESATPVPALQATPLPIASSIGSEYSPASMEALYADISEDQSPSLTADEKQRLPGILHRYEQGERPQKTILDLTEHVSLGVYTLTPEDYDGEKAYALLPSRTLADDEILQIVDAFSKLGIPFGDDTLSYRNCARGGGSNVSRPFTNEEGARIGVLQKLYRRQGLRPQAPFTLLPRGDGIGEIHLNEKDYHGMNSFAFFPYRRMTDEELLRRIDHENTGEAGVTLQQYADYERLVRAELTNALNAPIAIDLSSEGITDTRNQSDFLPDARVYSAHFRQPEQDGTEYYALLDIDTGKVLWAVVYAESSVAPPYAELRLDPFDTKWQHIAEDYVKTIRKDGVKIKAVLLKGETDLFGAGLGASVYVHMENGSEYRLTIPYQTEQVSPSIEYFGVPPTDEANDIP